MNKIRAAPNIDFSDSQFEGFHLDDRKSELKIYLTSWDERELCLLFFKPIHFFYQDGAWPKELYEIDTPQLEEIGRANYNMVISNHSFKFFQFEDIEDFSFIQVVAESVSVRKGAEIIGFRP